jgi:hypothetical protein
MSESKSPRLAARQDLATSGPDGLNDALDETTASGFGPLQSQTMLTKSARRPSSGGATADRPILRVIQNAIPRTG